MLKHLSEKILFCHAVMKALILQTKITKYSNWWLADHKQIKMSTLFTKNPKKGFDYCIDT